MTKRIIDRILHELTDRVGQVVYLDDVVKVTGLEPKQIQQAISNVRSRDENIKRSVQVMVSGRAWRYRPNFASVPNEQPAKSNDRKPAPVRMFEEVANLGADGGLILRCEDGTLYQAKELHT